MSGGTLDQIGIVVSCPECGQKNRLRYINLKNDNRCGKCKAGLPFPTEPVEAKDYSSLYALTHTSAVPVFVDFWAPWCGPCKMVAPEIEKVAANSRGGFLVVKVNTEEVPEVGHMHQINSIPTMAIFFQGRELNRIMGARPAPDIMRFVESAIGG